MTINQTTLKCILTIYAHVGELVYPADLGSVVCGFESHRAYHIGVRTERFKSSSLLPLTIFLVLFFYNVRVVVLVYTRDLSSRRTLWFLRVRIPSRIHFLGGYYGF